MGCVNHPNRKAVGRCEECLAGLCDSCTIHLEDGRTVCNRCMSIQFIEGARSEIRKRQLRREVRRDALSKKRTTYLQAVLMIGAVLVILLYILRIYWSSPIKHPQINLDPANPMRIFTNLQFSLERYATAHGDSYPDNLYDLLPGFLAETEQNRVVLRMLDYWPDQHEGYVLGIKENAPFPGKKLVATAEEIRLVEEE